MKKHYLLHCTILYCATSMNVATAEATDPAETVLATVNDKAITLQDYNEYIGVQPGAQPAPVQPAAVHGMVNRELVVQDAIMQGLDKDALYVRMLEDFKGNALYDLGMRKYFETHPIAEERLREEYGKIEPLKQYKARHILVGSRDEALALITEIQQGKNFAQLAAERSTDATTRPYGGDLGWLAKEQMFEPIVKAVDAMTKGSSTKEPIQTEAGWHVVLLEDIREVPPVQFDAARNQLEAQVRDQLMAQYIEELKKGAEVEIVKE